jgi:hypothetical protein
MEKPYFMCCNLVNRNDKTIITAVFNGCLMDENRNDSMESNVIIIAKDRDVQKDERKNRKHTKIMDDASSTGMKETSRNKKVVGKAPINEKSSLLGSNKPQLWLHIYKCKHDTTEENILSYLSNKLPNTTFEVKQLKKNTSYPNGNFQAFLDILNELFLNLKLLKKKVLIVGDYNIQFNKNNLEKMQFSDFVQSFDLQIMVSECTRLHNCLDNVLTNFPVSVNCKVIDPFLSDHKGLEIVIDLPTEIGNEVITVDLT